MRKKIIISLAAFVAIGCSSAAQQTNQTTNANTAIIKSNDSAIVSSHSNDLGKPNVMPANKSASASTESPMARPIDVAEMTADIEKAETEFKKNPKAKEELAKAYFVRATALTGAAQYRAALGDYRKGLKLDPNDEEARKMHDQILSIFKSIGREPPKEGEEPKPLESEKVKN
jgi:tetratricopeptide (TPR) repeat protein